MRRFEPLPGVGHCPQDEVPERVNALVVEFANELFADSTVFAAAGSK